MFEAEAAGIGAIRDTGSLRVPEPVCWGVYDDTAYLVLEYLELSSGGERAMAAMGSGLAALHGTGAQRFGWHIDNYIGSTPQSNTWTGRWVDFWRDHRLLHQLKLAQVNGMSSATLRSGEQLAGRLESFFRSYDPTPSLLHGDLWGGNFSEDSAGKPVVYDPAVYFGDREADVAMTELFGGFSRQFYESYDLAWPLDEGYAIRKTLYNLYHVLNHYNLFRGGYGAQATTMIHRLLAETG